MDARRVLDMAVNMHGIRIKIATGIPGLIVFLLGGRGLLLLAIRVPVKQVQYKIGPKPSKDAFYSVLSMMTGVERVVSERTERIPLLLWWTIQRRDIAERVKDSDRRVPN